jgi:DNA-binding response OmpR family regulator
MLGRVSTAAPQPPAPLALVVDDVPHVRNLLATLAARRGFQVEEAADGEAAVRLARERGPALILLDLRLPRVDGLQALAQIREADPQVAVVIVAAIPDRADLQRALDLGAVDFVRKPFDTAEVEFVLDRVYRAVTEDADLRVALDFVRVRTTKLEFPGRPGLLAKVVAWLGRELRQGYPGAEVPLAEIKLALYETFANAVEHGNLGITYDMKTQAMEQPGGMEALIRERMKDPRLAARKVHLEVTYWPDRVEYVVRDEGDGFDPQALRAKPLGDTTALHGRGLALVRHYMSEVAWNERGNEIRMVHEFKARAPRA